MYCLDVQLNIDGVVAGFFSRRRFATTLEVFLFNERIVVGRFKKQFKKSSVHFSHHHLLLLCLNLLVYEVNTVLGPCLDVKAR